MELHLYQICYDQATKAAIEPGFICLDNTENSRPDWYEAWPIMWFLQNQSLGDNDYYGFFSPRFHEKTGLTYEDVSRTVTNNESQGYDLFNFSPYFEWAHLHANPFTQGEAMHPGFLELSKQYIKLIGYDPSLLAHLVGQDRTVFCNYFVAKAQFWRSWQHLAAYVFSLAENNLTQLKEALTAPTDYKNAKSVQMKVFLIERLASLLLMQHKSLKVFAATKSRSLDGQAPLDQTSALLIACDALKNSADKYESARYEKAFSAISKALTPIKK